MSDFWALGPTAAALGLRAMGFTPREAERLVMLKLRYLQGRFPQPTLPEKHLRFARWLVEHGRLNEGETDAHIDDHGPLRAG